MSRDLSRTFQSTLIHLKPPARKGGKFASPIPTHFRPKPKFVQVKDRIPYWNITPEDKVVVIKGRKGEKGETGTVSRVERESNLVYLKEDKFAVKKRQPSQYPGEALASTYSSTDASASYAAPKPYHISNLRLQVTDEGQTYTTTRLRRSAISWDRSNRRFSWNRYGLVPSLVSETHTGWIKIPWPHKNVKPIASGQGPNDVDANVAKRSSWFPEAPARGINQQPHELKVSELELGGNYHSRANRTKRFNEMKQLRKDLTAAGVNGADLEELSKRFAGLELQ